MGLYAFSVLFYARCEVRRSSVGKTEACGGAVGGELAAKGGGACERWPGGIRLALMSESPMARLLPKAKSALVTISPPGTTTPESRERCGGGLFPHLVADRELPWPKRCYGVNGGDLRVLPRNAVGGQVDPPEPATTNRRR